LPRFLAIDADAHGLYVAAATVRGGSIKIEHALTAAADGQPFSPASAKALGAKLKELLKQAGVAPAPALVCVGRDRVILKEVRFPPTAPAEEPAVVRFQATKDLTEGADDVAVDYHPVPYADRTAERQALVVFLRREMLAAARVLCETAGLKLAGVTPRPFAAAAAAARAVAAGAVPGPDTPDAPVAVVALSDLGGEFTVVRGGLVKFSRNIPPAAVASEATLTGELRRNLAVYAGQPGGDDVQGLYLAEADEADGWSGRLRAALPVPVHTFDPLANTVAGEAVAATDRGRFVGPVGLLAARSGGQLPINFQQPRQPRGEISANRNRVTAGVLVGILLVGFGGIGGYLLVDSAEGRVAAKRMLLKQLDDQIAAQDLNQKRLAAADELTDREVVWADEIYDLSARFPNIERMRLAQFEGTALPPPTDKDRQKDEQLKANPQAAKNAPLKPVAKLRLTVITESPDLPNGLVSSFQNEKKYYSETKSTVGGLIGGAAMAAKTGNQQQVIIETKLAHRKPEDYKRHLDATLPKAPPPAAPKTGDAADKKKVAEVTDPDDEPGAVGPGSDGLDGGPNQ
jgi:Tfp pilus assembly PilM family ATPase